MASITDIREFWNEHICGDVFTSLTERGSKAYLDEVRRNRYRYEYQLMPFLRRVDRTGHRGPEIGCGIVMDLAELAGMGMQVVGL